MENTGFSISTKGKLTGTEGMQGLKIKKIFTSLRLRVSAVIVQTLNSDASKNGWLNFTKQFFLYLNSGISIKFDWLQITTAELKSLPAISNV
jgi:hypothetical protein